jgi:hypothetical protein
MRPRSGDVEQIPAHGVRSGGEADETGSIRARRVVSLRHLLALILTLGLTAGGAACGGGGDGDVHEPSAEAPPSLSGELSLETDIALPATVLAPAEVAALFEDLRATRDDPAGTWFTLLAHAGLPQARQLAEALPSVLAEKLEGWINGSVAAHLGPGKPRRAELDAVIDEATRMIGRFDVLSTLDVPTSLGDATPVVAVHAFAGVRFKLVDRGAPVLVPVPRFVAAHDGPVMLEAPVAVTLGRGPGGQARLTLSDHAFGLPLGQYLWEGIEARQRQRGGLGLRAEIGRLFDCPAVALAVSRKCVGPLCVGHAPELREVCDRGLDRVADAVKAKVEALRFEALRFASGSARIVDPPTSGADGRGEALSDGVWEATVDVGQGARRVDATFVGRRR